MYVCLYLSALPLCVYMDIHVGRWGVSRKLLRSVRACESKLCERVGENDSINAEGNPLEVSSSSSSFFFLYSSAYGLVCFAMV